jgi:hypothetical protein
MSDISMAQRDALAWYKSSFSSNQNGHDCVETARVPRGMAVRDSKNPDGPAYAFSSSAWQGLLNTLASERS